MVNLSKINEKPKRICFIDASTNSIAFAIFEDRKLEKYGKVNFIGINTYDKVIDAARKSLGLFKLFNVDSIVIEHTVYMNSPKTAADLALVQGAILGAAGINKVKISGSINPIAWQTFIGNGKLSKKEKLEIVEQHPDKSKSWYKAKEREIRKQKTINFININYGTNVIDNDIADAIAIGHYSLFNWDKIVKA